MYASFVFCPLLTPSLYKLVYADTVKYKLVYADTVKYNPDDVFNPLIKTHLAGKEVPVGKDAVVTSLF